MRERSIQLHMPRTDRPTHMIYVPVAPAAGFSAEILFSNLLKPDAQPRHL